MLATTRLGSTGVVRIKCVLSWSVLQNSALLFYYYYFLIYPYRLKGPGEKMGKDSAFGTNLLTLP